MNKPLALTLAAVALCLSLGCPKAQPKGVTGTDDEQMDQLSAQLEELRSRVQAAEPKCDEWCSMSGKVRDISTSMCAIAGRNKERAELQQKCVSSQEDVARFNDSCSSCRR
ncbi:MAG: hypothetical protein ACYC8T_03915 [Myxococcaceae bacterium]